MKEPNYNQFLLVDDDEDDFILVRQMLTQTRYKSYQLEWAETLSAGLQALKSTSYEAILVDYVLITSNGLELIREAVASRVRAPIILYTGHGSPELKEEALQAGATIYLEKNQITPTLLEQAIRSAIEGYQA